jgi:peptide/nickel transport system permease protein
MMEANTIFAKMSKKAQSTPSMIYRIVKSGLLKIRVLPRNERISFIFGLSLVCFMIFIAIFADFIAPYNPYAIHETATHLPPSFTWLFGTDSLGRDILSRVIYGTRISLLVSLGSVLIATLIGATLGVVTGYFGGNIDRLITLPMDALYSFPAFLTALLITVALGGGLL